MYRGSSDEEKTPADGAMNKLAYCNIISGIMQQKGLSQPRTANAIKAKIASIAMQYGHALDWRNNTGSGTDISSQTLHDETLKRCPLFFTLDPVFGEQGNATGYTNETTDYQDQQGAFTFEGDFEGDEEDDEGLSMSTSSALESTGSSIMSTSIAVSSTNTASTPASSALGRTPVTNNTSRRSGHLNISEITKKLKRNAGLFDDEQKNFLDAKMSLNNKKFVLEEQRDAREQELFSLEKEKAQLDVHKKREEIKREKMKWWVDAVRMGIYKDLEEAKKEEPLDDIKPAGI